MFRLKKQEFDQFCDNMHTKADQLVDRMEKDKLKFHDELREKKNDAKRRRIEDEQKRKRKWEELDQAKIEV